MEAKSQSKIQWLIYILLIAIIIGLIISNIYYINRTNQLKPKIVTQSEEKVKLKAELDILEAKITNITASKTRLSTAMQAKNNALKSVIGALRFKLSKGKLTSAELIKLKAELGDLKEQIKDYTAQIEILIKKNDSLKTVSDTLKSNLIVVNNKASNLEKSNAELDNKVKMGASLKLATTTVTAYKIRRSGKEIEDNYAPKVRKIKITFTIAINPIAKIGPHDIFAQVLDPSGKLMKVSDTTSFVADGKDLQSTIKTSIDFKNDGSSYILTWLNFNPTPLQPGIYTVMFYADGYTMGKTTFELKN